MEFDSEEQKQIYDKCKYIVKLWEHKFKRKNGRLPSKLDIREADSDVRNAYKTYFYLKASTLEKSFSNLEGFNFDDNSDVTTPSESTNTNCSATTVQEENLINNEKSNLLEPTLCSADFVGTNKIFGELSVEKNIDELDNELNDSHKMKVTAKAPEVEKKSNSKVSSLKGYNKQQSKNYLSNVSIKFSKRNPRKAVDNSAKKKSTLDNLFISSQKLNVTHPVTEDSEDILVVNSQVDISVPKENVHIQSTNLVTNFTESKSKTLRTVDVDWLNRVSQTTLAASLDDVPCIDHPPDANVTNDNDILDSEHIIDDSEDDEDLQPTKRQKITNVKCVVNISKSVLRNSGISGRQQAVRKTAESHEMLKDKLRNRAAAEITTSKKLHVNAAVPKQGATSVIPLQNNENPQKQHEALHLNNEEQAKMNTELSEPTIEDTSKDIEKRTLRPRKINPCYTYPVVGPFTSKLTSRTVNRTDDRRQRTKEVFERKVESGNLNDNFIRVNLKKKTYSRGKKNMNYSKYKKQQWKWRKKGMNEHEPNDTLLPIEAADDDQLPTVAEANERATKKGDETEKSAVYDFGGEDLDDGWDIENKSFSEFIGKSDTNPILEPEGSRQRPIDPLYSSTQNNEISDEMLEALDKFGYPSFRPGQELAISRILTGCSTLVTLSTGSGKSLCYLLPAYLYSQRQRCITLVVSPLVSLMDDQVDNVPHFMKAAAFHTAQTTVQRQKVKDAVAAGKISVLFVSPELLVSGEKSESLKSILSVLPPIAFACIDEAHCVSQWSHNFRPSYLLLCKVLKESLKVQTLLGLTATATKATCDSIKQHFEISEEGVISDVPLPENLYLTVSRVSQKNEALLRIVTSEEFSKYESIIVYCTRRDECEKVAGFLRTYLSAATSQTNKKRKRVGILAECYHAGLSASKRKSVQKAFMSGELRIVVATVAFGMGINKADIRAVIHYNLPKNVESYVQEVGRAGRDRLLARCHVFLDAQDEDKYELRRYAYSDSIDRHIIRKLLKKVFIPCQCINDCPKHEVCFSINKTVQDLDLPEEMIATVLCYLELHKNKYVNILSPAYSVCKITYAKVTTLKAAAEKSLPLSKAMALFPNAVKDNVFEFPVVEVAATLGMNSGFCKHKLKGLEWTTEGGRTKRSPINISFSDLGLRVSAPGNLTKNELDELLNSIHEQCVQNENQSLLQLEAIYAILNAAEKQKNTESHSDIIRKHIREYFAADKPLEPYTIPEESVDEESIANDVRALVSTYRDTNFTGRAVARIFHGIQSPNFKAYTWGRTKFWRLHLKNNFHTLSRIATREILALH